MGNDFIVASYKVKKDEATDFFAAKKGSTWSGYVWLSDNAFPHVVKMSTLPEYKDGGYIHEAMFVDEGGSGASFSILSREGLWVCTERIGMEKKPKEVVARSFSRIVKGEAWNVADIAGLKFTEYLVPEPDEFCHDFDVLVPAWIVFEGFIISDIVRARGDGR